MKYLLLVIITFFNCSVFAQNTLQLDREINQLGSQARNLAIERNAQINFMNSLIAQLNRGHDAQTYSAYLSKLEEVDSLNEQIFAIESKQKDLIAQKKDILDQQKNFSLNQLTRPDHISQERDVFTNEKSRSTTPKTFNVSENECSKLEQMRSSLPHRSHPLFLDQVRLANAQAKRCQIRAVVDLDSGDISAIELTNTHSLKTNPDGSTDSTRPSPTREFTFSFTERSRQNMHLEITDDVAVAGTLSADLMHKVMIFIPRTIFPYVKSSHEEDCCQTKVYLPTGEFAIFDTFSKEIVGGILAELPIDRSPNRHTRNFARIEYKGNGITIEASRRAGTPEHTYSTPFNSNENVKKAIIKHKGKVCRVSKKVIWENTLDTDKKAYFKYNTDQEFLDSVINKTGVNGCSWDLTMEDII